MDYAAIRDKRRYEILQFMASYAEVHHNMPSYQEIADEFGISKQVAWDHVDKLIDEHAVRRVDGRLTIVGGRFDPPDDLS